MSEDFRKEPLVSTQWLADHIDAPDLRIIDASYYLPGEGLDPRYEFEQHHIPGAVFFGNFLDDFAMPFLKRTIEPFGLPDCGV